MMAAQYKDLKDLKEIAVPLYQVQGFGLKYNNRALQVSCGDAFTLVLNEKNELYSFGKLSHGRLGLGSSYAQK